MAEPMLDSGEDIARFLEEHEQEIVVALREGFRAEYPESESNAMDDDTMDRWSAVEIAEFCKVLRGGDPEIRQHNVYEGDTGQNVDELIQPITTFIEGRLFIARTIARVIWRNFNAPVQPSNRALTLVDAAMLRIIRANLASFTENELVDGSLMRTWDFSAKASRTRTTSRPVRTATPTQNAAPQLTQREKQIALLVAQGRTNGEIAAQLGLSQSTVKNRLVRIYDKLGVNTRVELTSRVMRDQLA